jgi:exopolyphosphatase/guanosine-5'-triphosphate,3'-diphosphate pyrophosphatase
MFDRLAALPVGERRRVRGIEAERADIIIAGAALMVTFMEQVAAPEVIISDFGILEGLLLTHACGTMV